MNSPGRFLAALAVALILVPSSGSLAVGLHYSFGEHAALGLHEPLRLSGDPGHDRSQDHDGIHGHREHHAGEAPEMASAPGTAGHHHDDPTADDVESLQAVRKASPASPASAGAAAGLPVELSSVPARDVVPRLREALRRTAPPPRLQSLCTLLL